MNRRLMDYSSYFSPDSAGRIVAGISLVSAGNMNSFCEEGRENRRRFFSGISIPPDDVSFCKQIHSGKVFNADKVRLRGQEGDGMITGRAGQFLSVTAADCMPVYLFDPANYVLGLCHSGWKGTGIVLKALGMMESCFGTVPGDVRILLGPSIGACCYQVDRQRAELFRRKWGGAASVERNGGSFLDLRRANTNLLEQAGVENIASIDKCTQCNPEFGSFRREGPENYTRMAAYIGLLHFMK